MFNPKKEGRLSRRAARFTLLFWKPARWCMWFSVFVCFFYYFFPRMLTIACYALPFSIIGTFLSIILLINHLRCPHCDMPQLAFRGQCPNLEELGFWESFDRKFVAQWNSSDGGYCMWCDCLMEYDDVE